MAKNKRANNEGSIRTLENGRFRVEIMVDGHRSSATRDTRKECQDWLREKLNQRDMGYTPLEGKVSVREYLQRWMTRHSLELKGTTAKQYQNNLELYVYPQIGERELGELTLPFIDHYYSKLLSGGCSDFSLRYTHRILHKAFEDAIKYGYLLRNPTHGATLPRISPKEMMILEENEVSAFLIAARASRLEALFYLATVTGMRQGELFGLKWDDIQWQRGALRVQRQAVPIPGQGVQFTDPKTLAGRRTIKLNENTLDMLRTQKEHQAFEKVIAGTDWQEMGLVFTSTIGTVLNRSNVRKEFKRILELAGVPDIRFHDLRHTAASILLNNGVPVIVVSKMLGHSKVSVTMDTYGHLIPMMQDMATQVMADLVTPVEVHFQTERVTRGYADVPLKKEDHPYI
jgi:integrase